MRVQLGAQQLKRREQRCVVGSRWCCGNKRAGVRKPACRHVLWQCAKERGRVAVLKCCDSVPVAIAMAYCAQPKGFMRRGLVDDWLVLALQCVLWLGSVAAILCAPAADCMFVHQTLGFGKPYSFDSQQTISTRCSAAGFWNVALLPHTTGALQTPLHSHCTIGLDFPSSAAQTVSDGSSTRPPRMPRSMASFANSSARLFCSRYTC